jgi:hypothetical protein
VSSVTAAQRRHSAKDIILAPPLVTFSLPLGTVIRSGLIRSFDLPYGLETFAVACLLLRSRRQFRFSAATKSVVNRQRCKIVSEHS